jgi:enolase-phosphatase E1
MIKAILTDIEGTTSSLSFVKDVLFPYARANIAEFVHEHGHEPPVREQLDEVCRIVGSQLSDELAIEQLIRWIDEDKKVTPLKTLQGMIWASGYRSGDYRGHVYDDAARNLKKWNAEVLKLYVFSSGSVFAQKLIFGYSEFGDLTPLFAGYFDTSIGNKREADAYRKIARETGVPVAEMLFLSDIREELDAARDAGMQTIQLVRDGALDPQAPHRQVRSFDEIATI